MFGMCMLTNAHAATCDAGYWLDDTGTCQPCNRSNGETPSYYCPGNDLRMRCPEIDSDHIDYLHKYSSWVNGDNVVESITRCEVNFVVKIDHGYSYFSCAYNDTNSSFTSVNATYKCNFNLTSSIQRFPICDTGYWFNFRTLTNYSNLSYYYMTFKSFDDAANIKCIPVGWGYYSSDVVTLTNNCPVGTYTATDTAAAASDCMPCTNAPANAHYTAANTTDGTPNCPWECDDGFGHTSDDRCLPLCRIGETAMNGINIYAEKHTKYAMAVPRGDATCWINAKRGQGGKLQMVN
ncbi:MAG: hypothetical protein IJ560_02870 [Alphaproteobacteria bacterium]|nr:hypothetical protein [Alphaproteobacteria bacterium]